MSTDKKSILDQYLAEFDESQLTKMLEKAKKHQAKRVERLAYNRYRNAKQDYLITEYKRIVIESGLESKVKNFALTPSDFMAEAIEADSKSE